MREKETDSVIIRVINIKERQTGNNGGVQVRTQQGLDVAGTWNWQLHCQLMAVRAGSL